MKTTITLKKVRGRWLGVLAAALGPALATPETLAAMEQQFTESFANAAAKRGFAIVSRAVVDIQANWLSGGVDIRISAFVAKAMTRRTDGRRVPMAS